jgi:glycosyltransferase involved in cell wall biosynthesis
MTSTKPHILITTAWYPTDKSTSGVFVKEQGEALCRAGHRVTILLITYATLVSRRPRPQFDKSDLLDVVHLHVIFPLPGRLFKDASAYFKKIILKRVNSWMKEHISKSGKPAIIHHHCLSDNAYVAESLSKNFNIPYVFTEHSNYFTYEELSKFNAFETFEDHKRFVQHASERIAVSEVRAKGYASIFDAPYVVVSNMVQELFAGPLNPEAKSKRFTFVCVAILDTRKRQDLLIRAFAAAFKSQDVRLQLVGNGHKENSYRQLAAELGVTEQVEFSGKQHRENVKQIFDEAHVAVLSSDQETFGVVLAEAMFRGIPVISTICGGPEEIVTPETGLLCPKGDEAALTEAMKKMKTQYENYSPAVIRQYAQSHFSEQIIISELEAIYDRCIAKQK